MRKNSVTILDPSSASSLEIFDVTPFSSADAIKHWARSRRQQILPPKSSSSSAFRLASYREVKTTSRRIIIIRLAFTTLSGKFASSATWIPKLWSHTPWEKI